jgi:hypothetical protein
VTFVVLASSIGGSGFLGAPKGSMVNVWATAQDVSAQSVLAGIEGGDGIHEHYLTDGRLTQPGADARAEAELTLFKDPEQHGTFATRNTNAWPGVRFAVSVASPTHISSVQVAMKAIRWGSFERSTRAWSSSRTSPWPEAAVEYSTGAVRDLYQILGDLEREGR